MWKVGAVPVPRGRSEVRERLEHEGRSAGGGFFEIAKGPLEAFGVCERSDDVCATAFVYLREIQQVCRVDMQQVLADITRRDWESPLEFEALAGLLG